MDIKAKSEDISKKINAISEKLGLSEDLCCTGDELLPTIKEHYNIDEDTTIDDIKGQNLEGDELLDVINLQNMVSDFVYIRNTLKENTENGKKLINSISLSILDVDMENSAELISAFSELNRTLTENMKLYIMSYKDLSNIILNLNRVKEPKQVTNNHLNISTVNNIENSDQVPTTAISTADLLEQLRGK